MSQSNPSASDIRWVRTLRFQISLAMSLVVVALALSSAYTHFAIEQQRDDQVILNIAGRLQLTASHLASQGHSYLENAPRDYSTYYRDVRLYYRDLLGHVRTFDEITGAFMGGEFPPELTGLPEKVRVSLNEAARESLDMLEEVWREYRAGLMAALGDDQEEPRLEWAAEHAVKYRLLLEDAANRMFASLQSLVAEQLARVNWINRLVLALTLLISATIVVWFYGRVLRPLSKAVNGFYRVAQGDFGYQVTVEGDNELAWLTRSFNELSQRLHSLFRLITRVEQGGDLASSLQCVSQEFGAFLPIDWMAALFPNGDGRSVRIEQAFLGGRAEAAEPRQFPVGQCVVSEAMAASKPVHIPDLDGMDKAGAAIPFLDFLKNKGMRSAIFVPLTHSDGVIGTLVFAAAEVRAYTPQHLELLTNIAHLVTGSLGRTVTLVEQARLAAIGQFASGIAHEIRSPLGTIGMALDYFRKSELAPAARKRAELAAEEAQRVERLLQDMLLYAKPLNLQLRPLGLGQLVSDIVEANKPLVQARQQQLQLDMPAREVTVVADSDRLTQVVLNLLKNASEAAPPRGMLNLQIAVIPSGRVRICVHNFGDPVSPDRLPYLTEPFFTTKSDGTGLGLSIVKRIVDAHGGGLEITSSAGDGTRVCVTLIIHQSAVVS